MYCSSVKRGVGGGARGWCARGIEPGGWVVELGDGAVEV